MLHPLSAFAALEIKNPAKDRRFSDVSICLAAGGAPFPISLSLTLQLGGPPFRPVLAEGGE